MADHFSRRYGDLLQRSYDCVDRIVLNVRWVTRLAVFASGGAVYTTVPKTPSITRT